MVRKVVSIGINSRDQYGTINGYLNAPQAWTDDEGQSVLVQMGYLPNTETAPIGDINAEFVTITPIPHTQNVQREVVIDDVTGEPMQRLWFTSTPPIND